MTNQSKENKLTQSGKDEFMISDLASTYVQKAYKIPLLTASDEIELAKKAEQGDMSARKKFIESNLRLVNSFAWRYSGTSLEQMDLIQEGNLGLIRAVDTFDFRRGLRFSTYASMLIQQTVILALVKQSRIVRIPYKMVLFINEIKNAKKQLNQILGHEPSDEEISKRLEMPVKKIRELLKIPQEPIELDGPIGESMIDEQTKTPEEVLLEKDLIMEIDELLNIFPDRSKEIIQLSFGFDGRGEHSTKEIGKMIHVYPEGVNLILKRLLFRLRKEILARDNGD